MSHASFLLPPAQRLMLGLVLLSALCCLPSCSSPKPPKPPGVNGLLLPGVWRSSHDGFDIVWTFAAGGKLRWQLQPTTGWQALVGTGFDVSGHWVLVGDELTLELSETPAQFAFWGKNWNGQRMTAKIKTLTSTTLEFYDSDLSFQRSLAPAETK